MRPRPNLTLDAQLCVNFQVTVPRNSIDPRISVKTAWHLEHHTSSACYSYDIPLYSGARVSVPIFISHLVISVPCIPAPDLRCRACAGMKIGIEATTVRVVDRGLGRCVTFTQGSVHCRHRGDSGELMQKSRAIPKLIRAHYSPRKIDGDVV